MTSLQLSPDNQTLLSNAHDSTVRTWDVRPFAPADRSIMTYDGAPTGQERNLLKASWDSKGEKIAAGSGDQSVAIWEARTGKLLNKLPGHRGAVNDVRFHPLGEPLCKYQPFSLSRLPSLGRPLAVARRRVGAVSEPVTPNKLSSSPSRLALVARVSCRGFRWAGAFDCTRVSTLLTAPAFQRF